VVTFADMLDADARSRALNQEERDYIIRGQAARYLNTDKANELYNSIGVQIARDFGFI
jgi:hypothetical protein